MPVRPERRCHRILIDAPCSGLGVLRRHPELRWRRQPEDFARFAILQKSMLQQAAPYLQPGGVMLYITCTTEVEENEAVVRDFLASQPDFALRTPAAAFLARPSSSSIPRVISAPGRNETVWTDFLPRL